MAFDGLQLCNQALELSTRQSMYLELARNFVAIDNERQQDTLSQMAQVPATQSQASAGKN